MDDFTVIILLTLFGFLALAAILLVPVYRFLRREEESSRRWTEDAISKHDHAEDAGRRWSEEERASRRGEKISDRAGYQRDESDAT